MALSYDSAKEKLNKMDQIHLLMFWDSLEERQKENLLGQIETLNEEAFQTMIGLINDDQSEAQGADIKPAEVVTLSGAEETQARHAGEEALRAGEVGIVLVAGGQGTRLGFDGPKGAFPVGPLTNASLFEIHTRKILALERKYDTEIPFYIMTSLTNDEQTRRFFAEHSYFGLSGDRVKFFKQGMWPALDKDGKVILDRPDHIFMSPDGHGGVIEALRSNGIFEDMKKHGVETIFYFQVDNPLVEIADPAFVGLHRKHDSEMSVKVCAKRDPEEGLGVIARRDGYNTVVEYTELTEEQKHAVRPDGRLRFLFGSVAIHIFSLGFLLREAESPMPLHVAHKKVPYCDEHGKTIKPQEPNACKFEKFIFDILPDAERNLNLEFARELEFSPVKNASGSDSPETTRRDMTLKFAGWLDACGVKVPRDETDDLLYKIEIDPCFALGPEDLKAKLGKDFEIKGDLLLKNEEN
ncbi:UTP--glucose-1-phosphate uridylyltransferase [Verrucomicrobiota bacterium]